MVDLPEAGLVLVHGLFASVDGSVQAAATTARQRRIRALSRQSHALGISNYEWADGRGRAMANRMLRLARGTAPAVDAVEIMELDETAFHKSLSRDSTRSLWRECFSCAPGGFDSARSFVLIGAQRLLLDGPATGQRVLWFGRGLTQLGEADFVAHYTRHHGPLVAGHAPLLGLRRYRQVPGERDELCDQLRSLGLGQAEAPAVFAELFAGAPPINPASLLARRRANREIRVDEKRHIDFGRSMLLLSK